MRIPAVGSALAAASLTALVSMGASAQAATNLVQNGDFEINGGQGCIDFPSSSPQARTTTLADWINPHDIPNGSWGFNVVTSLPWLQSQNYYVPGMWGATPGYQNGNGFTTSPNGGWLIASDGFDPRTPIEQTISGLEVGATYDLSFQYAHAQEAGVDGNSYQHWQASFGGESFVTPTVYLPQHQFRGWYSATNTFTATSTSQVLSFLAFGTNGVPPYLLLDGVSLTKNEVPGPVPVLGLAGALAWSGKLRRRIQASGRNSAVAPPQ